jgi:hypothetical protein
VSPAFRTDGERSGEENDRRYRAMKRSLFRAQNRNRTVCKRDVRNLELAWLKWNTHTISIVQVQYLTPAGIYILVALALCAHGNVAYM